MTVIRRPVTRETLTHVRDRGRLRPLVVQLQAGGISLRLKGCRSAYLLPYESAWMRAAQLEADRQRAERKAARKERNRP